MSCTALIYTPDRTKLVLSAPQTASVLLSAKVCNARRTALAEREWILTDVIRRLFLGCLAFCLAWAVGLEAQAQVTVAYFDYDGTTVEHRQSQGGTHSTTHVLFRVQEGGIHLLAGIQPGPETIEVSQQDFNKLLPFLAKGHGQPGAINRNVTLEGGQVIQPGLYFMRVPETFKYFRESREPGRNYLLEDFKKAESRSENGEFKGRFWTLFQDWCSTKESADRFSILTARGHSQAEWQQLFDYMRSKGYIKYPPGRVINLSRTEYDRFGPPGDMPERKANFLVEQAQELARVDLPNGRYHSMIIADDEQRNLERIAGRIAALSNSGKLPIEFVLGNAGLRSEIRTSIRPEFAMIRPEGSFKSTVISSFSPAPVSKAGLDGNVGQMNSRILSFGQCEATFVSVGMRDSGGLQ